MNSLEIFGGDKQQRRVRIPGIYEHELRGSGNGFVVDFIKDLNMIAARSYYAGIGKYIYETENPTSDGEVNELYRLFTATRTHFVVYGLKTIEYHGEHYQPRIVITNHNPEVNGSDYVLTSHGIVLIGVTTDGLVETKHNRNFMIFPRVMPFVDPSSAVYHLFLEVPNFTIVSKNDAKLLRSLVRASVPDNWFVNFREYK